MLNNTAGGAGVPIRTDSEAIEKVPPMSDYSNAAATRLCCSLGWYLP